MGLMIFGPFCFCSIFLFLLCSFSFFRLFSNSHFAFSAIVFLLVIVHSVYSYEIIVGQTSNVSLAVIWINEKMCVCAWKSKWIAFLSILKVTFGFYCNFLLYIRVAWLHHWIRTNGEMLYLASHIHTFTKYQKYMYTILFWLEKCLNQFIHYPFTRSDAVVLTVTV